MRRKYENEEKNGVGENKRGKGNKIKVQTSVPENFSSMEGISSMQYQSATSAFPDTTQQSAIQAVHIGEFPAHTAVSVDVYEVSEHLKHYFISKSVKALLKEPLLPAGVKSGCLSTETHILRR